MNNKPELLVEELTLKIVEGAVVRVIQDKETVYVKLYIDDKLVSWCEGWRIK